MIANHKTARNIGNYQQYKNKQFHNLYNSFTNYKIMELVLILGELSSSSF